MFQYFIEAARLKTSLSLRQLLGSDVLGDIPGTEVDETDLFGRATLSEHPIRIQTFAGVGRHIPIVASSMVLTTVSTVFILSQLTLAATPQPSLEQVAMVSRRSSSSAAMTPLEARVKRLQQEHEQLKAAAPDVPAPASAAPSSSEPAAIPSSEPASSEAPSTEPPTPPVAVPAPLFPRSDNKVGVYLTASSVSRTKFFDETVDKLLAASGSALVMDVKGGTVLFHSAAPMANDLELVKPFYELPDIIRQLHERNIYVIGRFVAIKDAGFTEKKPETKIRHPKSGVVLSETWVDPSNDTAIEYNMQVVCELAAAGIDEINLDYIRFSTAQFGALGVYSGKEKADRVEKFIKATRETINRCGVNTKLGLSTFAILGWNYPVNVETLGQDVVRFAPLVDVISPMAYPATFTSPEYYIPGKNPGPRNYYLVYRTLTGYANLLGPDHAHKIRPWIQGYGVTAKDVTDEMRAVYDAGYCGFTVWNAGNNYSQTFKAISTDKLRPLRCSASPETVATE